MKTFILESSIVAGMSLAVALAVWTPSNSFAQEKGAQLLVRKAPVAAVAAPEAPGMACPKCKTEYTTRVDTTVRGVNKPTLLIASHPCSSCDTSIKQVGTGKAAQSVAVHTCSMGNNTPSNCCQ